ncbi:ATP-binding protein [Planotetraspora sp. A-T 1434]|uniref:ATP-binding protein n=1 Tax=Planotetraspora sp. A-T 1434 TaxID=2979219 RepID=UPI0021C064BC|nr:ATP-binding protein [Planotetraspora sp. A-T 1434]MCT9931458.1 ATP-binding protein [Planotetraspora sp. A-T 1434]
MHPDPGSARPSHNIAMWGAPGSGKTTLLASLSIALMRRRGPWKIIGADDPSAEFLEEKSLTLSRGEFPQATLDMESYRWVLVGEPKAPERRRGRLFGGPPKAAPAPRVGISLLDPPGGLYGDRGSVSATDQKELLDNLVQSRGIVFLFDPIREFDNGDAFDYLYRALVQLAKQILAGDDHGDGKLPHSLAVCITKFDDRRVLQTAERDGLLTVDPDDPHGFPRVEPEDAARLFHRLCEVSRSGNADLVVNALDQYFREDRIRFFVTSSIGFYLDPERNVFDARDFQNMVPNVTGNQQGLKAGASKFRIRGRVHPINVMEPMVWLGEQFYNSQPNNGTI